jgi:hypothetical protein
MSVSNEETVNVVDLDKDSITKADNQMHCRRKVMIDGKEYEVVDPLSKRVWEASVKKKLFNNLRREILFKWMRRERDWGGKKIDNEELFMILLDKVLTPGDEPRENIEKFKVVSKFMEFMTPAPPKDITVVRREKKTKSKHGVVNEEQSMVIDVTNLPGYEELK